MDKDNLFKEFNAVSPQEWRAKLEKDLKGKPFEELLYRPEPGLELQPYYMKADVAGSKRISFPSSQQGNTWSIGERFYIRRKAELKEVNKELLNALMGGLELPVLAVEFDLTVEDWLLLLEEVELDYIGLHIVLGANVDADAFFKSFSGYFAKKDKDLSSYSFCVERGGYRSAFPRMKGSVGVVSEGESTINCLAEAMTDMVDEIMKRRSTGSDDEALLGGVAFRMSVDSRYFLSIAKIRAMKILWSKVREGFGCPPLSPPIMVETSAKAYGDDRHTNMIRAATMAMSAVIGGCDTLVIRPADGEGETFTRRIARNVQHILKMESYMDKVVDPAAGSYYIEEMTNLLVEGAWAKFLELEKNKG